MSMNSNSVCDPRILQAAPPRSWARSVTVLLALYLTLTIWAVPRLFAFAPGKPVTITVQVLDPSTSAAKRLPRAKVLHNGNPVVSMALVQGNSRVTLLANSLLILHGARGATYTTDRPDVLAPASGLHHFPSGVQGLVQAKKPGTAILTVVDAAEVPVCPAGVECGSGWSGYSLHAGAPYTGITGQWTVPTIATSSPQGESSTWIGIGGDGTDSLIQAGTYQIASERDNPFDSMSYDAFYELFPDSPIGIARPGPLGTDSEYPVAPGDVIKVQILPSPGAPMPVDHQSGSWSIQVVDVTQNWTYQKTVQYDGALNSAEWIIEAPMDERGQTQMADYQQVEFNFGNQVATGGGPLAPVQFTTAQQVWQNQGGSSGTFSTPSDPSGDKKDFYVSWSTLVAHQAFPPGPWIQTTSLPPAVAGQPYSTALLVNQAATPVWTVVGTLPDGLQLDPATGVLSGTPTLATTFNFSVFATDTADGSYTATQPLTLAVKGSPYASLQLTCIEFGPVPPTGIDVAISSATLSGTSVPAPCNQTIQLPVDVYSVVGLPVGNSAPYKVTYSGSCSATGQLTLTQSEAASCTVLAETLKAFESACPLNQHCCEPSATGCQRCIPLKQVCQ